MIRLDYVRISGHTFTSQIFADDLDAWQRSKLNLFDDDTSVTIFGEFTLDLRGSEPVVHIEYVHALKGSRQADLTADHIDMEHISNYILEHSRILDFSDDAI